MDRTNLSDHRGNSAGIGFFHLLLKIGGTARTWEFVRFISFFYAVFDRKARQSAIPVLGHLFPAEKGFRRFLRTWNLFTAQGRAMVFAEAMRQGKISWRYENQPVYWELEFREKGFLLLGAHFGCWQAMEGSAQDAHKTVVMVMAPDRNRNVDKRKTAEAAEGHAAILSTASEMGGIPEICAALESGKIVSMMGDRCREGRGVPVRFLGEDAIFPAAAFFLAARMSLPVLPALAYPEGKRSFVVRYGTPLYPQMQGRDRDSLKPWIQQYAAFLEEYAKQMPEQLFLFDDIWNHK